MHEHSIDMGTKGDTMWFVTMNGIFLVRSFYSSSNKRVELFPYATIWEATWSRITTLDQLEEGGRLEDSNRSYMCKEEEEIIYNILLHSSEECLAFFFFFWVCNG